MSEITITDKTLSRIVDRLADALRSRPEATKSALLNIVAAEIAGPGHDWGLVKNAARIASRDAPKGPALPDIPALGRGPVLVGTHFGVNDLPGRAFGWNPDEAEGFLAAISEGLRDAMISAGNEYIGLRMSQDVDAPDGDEDEDDYDTFDHPAYRAREVGVMRLSDGAWLDRAPGWTGRDDRWVSVREDATSFLWDDALNMALPAGCVLVPAPAAGPAAGPEYDAAPEI